MDAAARPKVVPQNPAVVWAGTTAILMAVTFFVGVFAFKLGDWLGGPAINAQHLNVLRDPSATLGWSRTATQVWVVGWMLGAAVIAVALALPLLRRARDPLPLAIVAGLVPTIFFVIGSDNLRAEPLGDAGETWNLIAIVALFAPLWLAALAGEILRRRRAAG